MRVLLGNVFAHGEGFPDDNAFVGVVQAGDFSGGRKFSEVILAASSLGFDELLLEWDVESLEEDPWSHRPGGVSLVGDVESEHAESQAGWTQKDEMKR